MNESRKSAEQIFGEYLLKPSGKEPRAFETLCEEQPEHANELRRLHENWMKIGPLLDEWADGAEPVGENLPPDLELCRMPQQRFEYIDELGRGGVGVVFRVFDRSLRRVLALKRLHSQAQPTPTERSRFLREAHTLALLDHPNIVPVHEAGIDDEGRIYFAMKLIEGDDLDEILRGAKSSQAWSTRRLLGVLQTVCHAVAHAHEKRVVHRDLKPTNIRVGSHGDVYVVDWGLARLSTSLITETPGAASESSASPREVTLAGEVMGTPAYMSPEQADGRIEDVGPASDIYSAGAILYRILTGFAPYTDRLPGTETDQERILSEVRSGPPTPIRPLAPDANTELIAICQKAMARETSDRYSSMGDLAVDIDAFLDGRVVMAHESGAIAGLRKWVLRHKAVATALGFAYAGVLAALATMLVFQSEASRQADAFLVRWLVDESDRLWPATPESVPRMERWLELAHQVVARRPELLSPPGRDHAGGQPAEPDFGEASAEREPATALGSLVLSGDKNLLQEIESRLLLASTVEERSTSGPAAQARWRRAIASIADVTECPPYGGLRIEPQVGLLPIGRNPHSGLWEFTHLLSGGEPSLDERTGEPVLDETTGVVLVLVPGGTFAMGAGRHSAGRWEEPEEDELPSHEVTLNPFFVSKYELTRAQWEVVERLSPVAMDVGVESRQLLPATSVPWTACRLALSRLALEIPTEAQWEYCARAGTRTWWWTGDEYSSLEGTENVKDETYRREAGTNEEDCVEWEDGFVRLAPVGSFRPNPFGLYDVAGNAWEWCREWYYADAYSRPTAADDGEKVVPSSEQRNRVARGGCCASNVSYSTSSGRSFRQETDGDPWMGVRPVRPLDRAPK